MELGFTAGIAAIVLFGVLGQILGRATRIPSIILVLMLGLLMGPVLGWVNPDAILGERSGSPSPTLCSTALCAAGGSQVAAIWQPS